MQTLLPQFHAQSQSGFFDSAKPLTATNIQSVIFQPIESEYRQA
jgi:hypothetical protein